MKLSVRINGGEQNRFDYTNKQFSIPDFPNNFDLKLKYEIRLKETAGLNVRETMVLQQPFLLCFKINTDLKGGKYYLGILIIM